METLIQSESFICWKLKHVLFKQKSSIFSISNQPCTCCKCRHEIGDNTALIVMMREMRLRLLPIRRQCPQIVSCRTGPSSTLGHGIRTFMVSSGSFSFACHRILESTYLTRSITHSSGLSASDAWTA